MMKGAGTFAVAVRKASGEITVRDFPLKESPARKCFAKVPAGARRVDDGGDARHRVPGAAVLGGEAVADTEGEVPAERRKAAGSPWPARWRWRWRCRSGCSSSFRFTRPTCFRPGPGPFGLARVQLVDGAIRVLVFILYIAAISMMKDIRRIFEYHGASTR
jgi:hypothetical protein